MYILKLQEVWSFCRVAGVSIITTLSAFPLLIGGQNDIYYYCSIGRTLKAECVLCLKVCSTLPTGTVDSLTTGATVGIVLACTAAVIFSVGVLVGVLIFSKQRSQSPKPDSSLSHQQEQTSNPLQQTSPEYAEVIKLRQNKAYELTQTGIKVRANEAYRAV